MGLSSNIDQSIGLIRHAESLALKYNDFGFHVAFSGGKDSQVIFELCKMAGVRFKLFFYKTSVDPPELLSFIRSKYPSVIWLRPEMSMFSLILKKGMLPMRNARFCCAYLKERNGLNSVVITGISKFEGVRRKKRQVFEATCVSGLDKNLLNPILHWSNSEVLRFLNIRKVEQCSLYSIQNRIGCVGCPSSPVSMRRDFLRLPNFKKAYVNTVSRLMAEQGKYLDFIDALDVVDWWSSGVSKAEWFGRRSQFCLSFD